MNTHTKYKYTVIKVLNIISQLKNKNCTKMHFTFDSFVLSIFLINMQYQFVVISVKTR